MADAEDDFNDQHPYQQTMNMSTAATIASSSSEVLNQRTPPPPLLTTRPSPLILRPQPIRARESEAIDQQLFASVSNPPSAFTPTKHSWGIAGPTTSEHGKHRSASPTYQRQQSAPADASTLQNPTPGPSTRDPEDQRFYLCLPPSSAAENQSISKTQTAGAPSPNSNRNGSGASSHRGAHQKDARQGTTGSGNGSDKMMNPSFCSGDQYGNLINLSSTHYTQDYQRLPQQQEQQKPEGQQLEQEGTQGRYLSDETTQRSKEQRPLKMGPVNVSEDISNELLLSLPPLYERRETARRISGSRSSQPLVCVRDGTADLISRRSLETPEIPDQVRKNQDAEADESNPIAKCLNWIGNEDFLTHRPPPEDSDLDPSILRGEYLAKTSHSLMHPFGLVSSVTTHTFENSQTDISSLISRLRQNSSLQSLLATNSTSYPGTLSFTTSATQFCYQWIWKTYQTFLTEQMKSLTNPTPTTSPVKSKRNSSSARSPIRKKKKTDDGHSDY